MPQSSARGDRVDTDKAKVPRSSSAEEALVVYLINNPDSAERISGEISAEQFQNSLMRRYYEYFLFRIKDGKDALNSVSADFTSDEVNKIYGMLRKYASVAQTKKSLEEYIKVIREESAKPKHDEVGKMSGEELNDYLRKLREAKK